MTKEGEKMSIQGVSSAAAYDKTAYASNTKEVEKESAAKTEAKEEKAAVYEKSDESKNGKWVNVADPSMVARLKAEAEQRSAAMRSLVEKMMMQQGDKVNTSGTMADLYRSLTVDPQVKAQAQADIGENGYWGVEQTSDRIVSFAKAMAGEDVELAKKMIDAVKEGFGQAEKKWGEKLPDISQKTMDSTYSKLDSWLAEITPKEGAR